MLGGGHCSSQARIGSAPGESLHEVGLAVDFSCAGALVNRTNACFAWLSARAGAYGLANLPSEPWHWSVGGR